ncbi:MAG: GNAT family N-acetyltransferase [Streptococcus parasanguinis]|nr:GNAT family N-acetyltransferase [Streptococcus parasanguinis]
MKEDLTIRQACLDDLDAIERIEQENFSAEEAIAREILRDHIEAIRSTFLVAESKGQILGYLEGPVRPERYLIDSSFSEVEDLSHIEKGFISITSLSIAKEAQGLGVGRLLLEAMKEIAIKDDRQGINLTCHDYLIPYYEKHGFTNEGLSDSQYAGEVWYNLVWERKNID